MSDASLRQGRVPSRLPWPECVACGEFRRTRCVANDYGPICRECATEAFHLLMDHRVAARAAFDLDKEAAA